MSKVRVAIAGVSGYTGYELYRMLRRHPQVDVTGLTSEQSAGLGIDDVFVQIDQRDAGGGLLQRLEDLKRKDVDTVFMCLPHRAAADWVAKHQHDLPQIIDLSADFRLKDSAAYETWYGFAHPASACLSSAVYGLTEFNRAAVSQAKLIANPGCYPTAAMLGLVPLLKQDFVDNEGTIIIDAKSGVSGAGRKASLSNSFAEANENLSPYGLANTHRHVPEIAQGLQQFSKKTPEFLFTPHLIPVTRGMLITMYVPLCKSANLNAAQARSILEEEFHGHAFVRVLPSNHIATIAHVVHTNQCALSVHQKGRHLVIVSAIDNLLKGASGQAMQNFNISHDFAETEGIL